MKFSFVQEGILWRKVVFLNCNINLQNTRNLSLSNHVPEMKHVSETRIVWWKAP